MRPTRARLALACLAVAALLAPPAALAHGPDPVLSGALWAQNRRLEFRWRSGAAPPAAIKTAIKAAAADVGESRASEAATFAFDADASNLIGYGVGATCSVNGIACFTRSVPNGFTMWLREHGRVFDWGRLRWCQMYDAPPDGCYDAETIALDEFGHIEVLAHHVNYADDRDYTDAVVQTISRTKPRAGWNMHVFGRCDVARLQIEYDVPTTNMKYSTCLELATVLTIGASVASVPYGGTTTLTAMLKVASNDAYERLRGNPVSRRTVRLQRRPRGTTAWTTVGTMSVGSSPGTYVLSQSLTAATEFRAVFPTPSDEGLDGDTSPTLLVTVGPCQSPCPMSAEP